MRNRRGPTPDRSAAEKLFIDPEWFPCARGTERWAAAYALIRGEVSQAEIDSQNEGSVRACEDRKKAHDEWVAEQKKKRSEAAKRAWITRRAGGVAKPTCAECGKTTQATHAILGISLCRNCQKAFPEKYGFVTKTRALREFRLKPEQLETLDCFERDNPHFKCASSMKLYLLPQVQALADAIHP